MSARALLEATNKANRVNAAPSLRARVREVEEAPAPLTAEAGFGHDFSRLQVDSASALSRSIIQRMPDEPKREPARKDVVFVLSPDVGNEAPVVAPGVEPLHVTSVEKMASVLKKIDYPVRTMFILSHSLATGDLGFGTAAKLTFVLPSKIAGALKGALKPEFAPELMDFRGCTIGVSPDAMEQMRAAVGAGAVIGGNCFLVTQRGGPVSVGGKAITKPTDVTDANRAVFQEGLRKQEEGFGSAKGCILNPGEEGYFRGGGFYVAQWFSPELSEKWDKRKSRCYSALKPETVDPAKVAEGETDPGILGHCRLIRVEKGKK